MPDSILYEVRSIIQGYRIRVQSVERIELPPEEYRALLRELDGISTVVEAPNGVSLVEIDGVRVTASAHTSGP